MLCLKNMVASEEVDEQLQEEIEEECSKYGDVENVVIYQERQSEEENAEVLVKIFVEFSQPSHAKVEISMDRDDGIKHGNIAERQRQSSREILCWKKHRGRCVRSTVV